MKVDPSGALLHSFIDLNNMALSRFSAEERARIGIHTCPGGDRDSTHSADVDYGELLPSLFELQAGNFYVALAGEEDRVRVLRIIRQYLKPNQRVFIGVIATIDPRIETPEEVRDLILEAARYIPVEQLGTTDDCGFSPFSDERRPLVTRRSRRSARGSRAPGSPRKRSEPGKCRAKRGRGAPPLRRDPEREEHPARAPAGGAGAASREAGAGAQDAGAARDPAGDVGRDPGHGRAGQRDGLQPQVRRDVARASGRDGRDGASSDPGAYGAPVRGPATVPVPNRGDLHRVARSRASMSSSCRTEGCSSGTRRPSSSTERNIGRVWCFRDITESRRSEEMLRDESRVLELLNRTGTMLSSKLDLQALVQAVTDAATELSGAKFGAFFYNTDGRTRRFLHALHAERARAARTSTGSGSRARRRCLGRPFGERLRFAAGTSCRIPGTARCCLIVACRPAICPSAATWRCR